MGFIDSLKANQNLFGLIFLERGRRIELLALAWKAKVLPLYEPRTKVLDESSPNTNFIQANNSSIINGGEGWIRTSVLVRGQIYSLLPLTTRPPLHNKPQIMP